MKKKFLSVVLAAVMFLICIPLSAISVAAASPRVLSETEFTNKLTQLRVTYPNGGTYSGTYYENGAAKAWTCFGYACQMFYEVFGVQFYADGYRWKTDYTMGTIYAGDFVRLDAGYGPDTHSVFVTKVTNDRIYFTDANFHNKNDIRWDASYTKEDFAKRFTYKVHISSNTLTGNGSTHTHSYDTYVYYWAEHPHYKCYQCSCGDVSHNMSETTELDDCIICCTPEKPALLNINEEYNEGDSVTFSWNNVDKANRYDFWLYKKNGEEWDVYEHTMCVENGFNRNLPTGQYRCMLLAYNDGKWNEDYSDYIYTKSDYFYFSVNDVPDTYENLSYEINNGEVTITDCNSDASGALEIPATIEGYPVTSIGDYAFWNCTSLILITIPDSVTSIGTGAFCDCTSLTSIAIPDSVTTIGFSAFFNCTSLASVTISNSVTSISIEMFYGCTSLTSVIIPDSVTAIHMDAFSYCSSLASVTIPNSVTSIGSYAFCDCTSLTSIAIPDSVTGIGRCAFSGCDALTSITVEGNNKNYCSVDGVLFNKQKTTIHTYPDGKRNTSYTIPNSVTTIGSAAFHNCPSLTSIIIPDSVTSVEEWVTFGCGFNELTVYYIGTQAQWEKITIAESMYSSLADANIVFNCVPAKITTQPKSVTVANGETATVSVEATGDGLTYAWYYKNVGVDDFGLAEGVVGSSYLVEMNDKCAGQQVYCVVTDQYGNAVHSDVVVLDMVKQDIPSEEPAFTINVSDAVVRAGDTFTVTVNTKNNPGIVSLKIDIGYDANVLELISINGQDFAGSSFGPLTANPIAVNWYDTLNPNNTTDGVVAALTFKVKEDAVLGDTTITLSYNPNNVYDYDFNDVTFATVNGAVSVVEYISGDANGDGVVNNKDLGVLQRYINGWDVDVNVSAGDVNGDGSVNNKDLGVLQRYINGWEVELK